MILLKHDENGNWVQIELTSEEAEKYLEEYEEGLRTRLQELADEIGLPRCYNNIEMPSAHYDKRELKLIETKDHIFEIWDYEYNGDECYKECLYADDSYDKVQQKYREVIYERS